jgi:hypothetical protein
MSDTQITRIHCNGCGRTTRHRIVSSFTQTREDEVEEIETTAVETTTIAVLECLGCEALVVQVTAEHDVYGEADPRFYPPPISRPMPRWSSKLPWPIQAVLREVYGALQAGSYRLATMGARTVVDLVITDKVGDTGTFASKLEALEKQGFVGRKNREVLSAALEAGNAAAHRGLAPESGVLNHVMDIVENLLEAVYTLEQAANDVRRATPPRKPSKQ